MRYILILLLIVGCKKHIEEHIQNDSTSTSTTTDQTQGHATSDDVKKTVELPGETVTTTDEYDVPVPDAGPSITHGALRKHTVVSQKTGGTVTLDQLKTTQDDYGLKTGKVDTTTKNKRDASLDSKPSGLFGFGIGIWIGALAVIGILVVIVIMYIKRKATPL